MHINHLSPVIIHLTLFKSATQTKIKPFCRLRLAPGKKKAERHY